MDFYGAWKNAAVSDNHKTFTVHTPNKHLKKVLSIIKDFIISPTFPIDKFEVIKNKDCEQIKLSNEQPRSLSYLKFKEVMFGSNTPLGKTQTIEILENT